MWERRDRDVGLAVEGTDDTQLDLPSYFRCEIVRQLLETDLRARDVGEVLIRQRHMIEQHTSMPEVDRAVLLDPKELVAQQQGRGRATKAAGGINRPSRSSQPDMFTYRLGFSGLDGDVR